MKIKISEKDSLYKIFKTLEKISTSKKVEIYIDEKNDFFDNIWWGKQVIDVLETKKIDYSFVCYTERSKQYYEQLGIQDIVFKKKLVSNLLKSFYDFFFTASDIHGKLVKKKSAFSYVIICFEICAVAYLLYVFYGLISPYGNVYIKPSYTVEEIVYNYRVYPDYKKESYADSRLLGFPYYSGSVNVSKTMNIGVENIKYLQKPAKGKLKLINNTENPYSFVANTKFVTESGLLFKSTGWFNLPGMKGDKPGEVLVDVEAMETDVNGQVIGARGNLKKGDVLYIKNLKDSFFLREIYSSVENDFVGGDTSANGTVTLKDIDSLKSKLTDYIQNNKKELIDNALKGNQDFQNMVIMNFDDLFKVNIGNIKVSANVGDAITNIEGTVSADISYKYLNWNDIRYSVNKYIADRIAENLKLIDLDKSSFVMFEKKDYNNYFVIPAKVDAIWGYDFDTDVNGIKNEIKSKIAGKSIADAKAAILEYPEIDVAIIDVSPPWYHFLSNLKSRINIHIKN